MEITTNAPKTNRSITVDFDFGGALDKAVEMFTAEVVYSNFEDNAVIALQSLIRRYLEKSGEKAVDDDFIREKVAAWKPGIGAKRGDPIAALLERFGKMSAEKQAEILAKLTGANG